MHRVQKLLFLTTDLPYPPVSGGTVKSFRLLEFLARHFEVTFLCTRGGSEETIRTLQSVVPLALAERFSVRKGRSLLTWARSMIAAPSLNAYRNHSPALKRTVELHCMEVNIVFADHLEVMPLIPKSCSVKLIYHSHNAEFRLWQEMADRQRNLFRRWAVRLEAQRVARLERQSIERSDLCFAAPNDITSLCTQLHIDRKKLALTYHLGNDAWLDLPPIDLAANPRRVLYAGTLGWEPNSDGMKWFLREVWPRVKAVISDAELTVCGKGADEELVRLMNDTPGVDYRGFVEDLEAVMHSSRAAVVPLRFGSGMKIKTFDALYRGLPLVTTSIGAEGIDLSHGEHAFITNDEAGFAGGVIEMLRDVETAEKIARKGREKVQLEYTYRALLPRMLSSISERC